MQVSIEKITSFIILSTALLFILTCLVILLMYSYKKGKLLHQQTIEGFQNVLLKTQIEIQEQTFHNISREIHDNINLSLTLVKLNLNTLNLRETKTAERDVKSSINIISSAIADLSNLSKSINPELIRNLGLTKAVSAELEKVGQMAHLQIEFEIKGEQVFMDSEKELVLFRIIQESFNNIIKHSNATKVTLQMNYGDSILTIRISDNGLGFDAKAALAEKGGNKAGLSNMQTRAKLFGGRVNIQSDPGNGTHLDITIPY
ncbi:MAG TPA: ATP-binding protein [Flavisolibacter sp.]|nr:ATP-binding protein [Flavisolibacter sp.]